MIRILPAHTLSRVGNSENTKATAITRRAVNHLIRYDSHQGLCRIEVKGDLVRCTGETRRTTAREEWRATTLPYLREKFGSSPVTFRDIREALGMPPNNNEAAALYTWLRRNKGNHGLNIIYRSGSKET
jgi:hypothetical protein